MKSLGARLTQQDALDLQELLLEMLEAGLAEDAAHNLLRKLDESLYIARWLGEHLRFEQLENEWAHTCEALEAESDRERAGTLLAKLRHQQGQYEPGLLHSQDK